MTVHSSAFSSRVSSTNSRGSTTANGPADQPELARQRLQLLGSLSSMVAHEFNNLMTPVLARAQFAASGDDVAMMRKALDVTASQVRRALDITRHILDFASGARASAGDTHVADAVRDALLIIARPLEKSGIQVTTDIADDARVQVSPLLLTQVFVNLVLNARAAMDERGGRLTISAERDGSYVLIRFTDSGCGVPRERIDRVINPFLRGQASDQADGWMSVGLGLNICRIIAESHQATIEMLPNEGLGVTVCLRWPAA